MYNEVQFEDQNVDFHRNARVVQKSTMVKLFEKMGVPEEYVSVVMIGVAVVFFVIAGFILFKPSSGNKHPRMTKEALDKLMQTPPTLIKSKLK